jgi:hypothetical protein
MLRASELIGGIALKVANATVMGGFPAVLVNAFLHRCICGIGCVMSCGSLLMVNTNYCGRKFGVTAFVRQRTDYVHSTQVKEDSRAAFLLCCLSV